MSSNIPPISSEMQVPENQIDVYSITDAKIRQLDILKKKPKEDAQRKFVAVKVEEGEGYLKLDDLSKVTGISQRELAGKTPEEILDLINRQNYLLEEVAIIINIATLSFQFRSDRLNPIAKFAVNQLRGREHPDEAISKLKELAMRIDTLNAAVLAGRTTAFYVGKTQGVTVDNPSLLIADGNVYVGGRRLAKGGTSKVSELASMPMDPYQGVKQVARGQKRVENLEKHLALVERLTQAGVPHITPVHRMKVLTTTKAGRPKLVALVNRADGDGLKFVKNLKISSFHLCNALINIGEALAAMHALNPPYVHGDLKPNNTLIVGDTDQMPEVDTAGNLLVAGAILHDFGSAGAAGDIIGDHIVDYRPPEVFYDDSNALSPEEDLFAFGVTILEMTTSRHTGNSQGNLFGELQDQTKVAERLKDLKSRLFRGDLGTGLNQQAIWMRIQLVDVAERLIQLNPQDRIAAQEVVNQLKEILKNGVADAHKEVANPGYIEALLKTLDGVL